MFVSSHSSLYPWIIQTPSGKNRTLVSFRHPNWTRVPSPIFQDWTIPWQAHTNHNDTLSIHGHDPRYETKNIEPWTAPYPNQKSTQKKNQKPTRWKSLFLVFNSIYQSCRYKTLYTSYYFHSCLIHFSKQGAQRKRRGANRELGYISAYSVFNYFFLFLLDLQGAPGFGYREPSRLAHDGMAGFRFFPCITAGEGKHGVVKLSRIFSSYPR